MTRKPSPAIVLVEPQLGANVGAAARAMLNCGLTDLRLVKPRDGWPSGEAWSMASGADAVLDGARLFDTAAEAVADLQHVYATTARRRDMVKHELTPERAAVEIRRHEAGGERCGILFGRERIGLVNDEVALAERLVVAPLNPEFSSLNLAQAVLLMSYEWLRAADETPPARLVQAGSRRANRDELLSLLDHLERELDAHGFYRVPEKRPITRRKIRNVFVRAELTEQEARILHGVIAALAGGRRDEA